MSIKKHKIFVINLDRSVSRWQKIKTCLELQKLPYERFSAIDGKLVSDDFLNQYYSQSLNKARYYTALTKPEIACYISHLKVCKKIIEENLDYGIILEDDLLLDEHFHLIPHALNAIEEKWSYIKLIAPFKNKQIISRKTVPFTISQKCDIEDYKFNKNNNQYDIFHRSQNLKIPFAFELVRWNKPPTGTQAYAITREAAIEFIKKRSTFFRPIDVDLQFTWETNLDVQGLLPFHCLLSDEKSEIGNRKNYRPHYPLARFFYKLKYIIASSLYKKTH